MYASGGGEREAEEDRISFLENLASVIRSDGKSGEETHDGSFLGEEVVDEREGEDGDGKVFEDMSVLLSVVSRNLHPSRLTDVLISTLSLKGEETGRSTHPLLSNPSREVVPKPPLLPREEP